MSFFGRKPFNQDSLHKYLAVAVVVLIWLALAVTNIQPGTRLLSWDVMDSSLDPVLNLTRSVTSVWQSFQGLGFLGGHGYVAQFPHALIQLVLAFFIPADYLRYAFAFGMLLTGGLGCLFFMLFLLRDHLRPHSALVHLAATLASAVYLLHLGTMQTFSVHLEPFIIMYGVLPWTLLSLFKLLKKPRASEWLIFFCLNVLLSVTGFIPPVFISYVLFVSIALGISLMSSLSRPMLRRCLGVVALIAAANLYWLVTVATFTLQNQTDYLNSKLNQLTTQEYILNNQFYGKLDQVALLKSFYLDSLDQNRFSAAQPIEFILKPWIDHFSQPLAPVIGYAIFACAVIGFFMSCVQLIRTRKVEWGVSLFGLLTFTALATGVPGFAQASSLLRLVPFLNQAFRIPFSKLSMSISFFIAVFLGVVIFYLFLFVQKVMKSSSLYRAVIFLITMIFCIGLLYYALPSFQGNFLYKGARVHFPPEYQQLFDLLREKPKNARIANFPILTLSGWDMHHWPEGQGYTGSGFYWYGAAQPILSRSFDVWSPYNETYRNEMVRAVYNEDSETFEKLLEKYDIQLILIDKSIYVPENKDASLYYAQLEQLLQRLPSIKLEKKFDFLQLYSFTQNQRRDRLFFPENYTTAQPFPQRNRVDTVYETLGNSMAGDKTLFPLSGLSTEHTENVTVIENQDSLTLTTKISSISESEKKLILPQPKIGEVIAFQLSSEVVGKQLTLDLTPFAPTWSINNTILATPSHYTLAFPFSKTGEITIQIGEQKITQRSSSLVKKQLGFLRLPYRKTFEVSSSGNLRNSPRILIDERHPLWSTIPAGEFPVHQTNDLELSAQIPLLKAAWNPRTRAIPSPGNCSFPVKGEVNREFTSQGVKLTAADRSTLCDFYLFPELSSEYGYLIHVAGEQKTGKSPIFFVKAPQNDRSEIQYQLPSKKFSEIFSLLPNTVHKNLSIGFELKSYDDSPTNAEITDASFFTIPTEQLLSAYITGTSTGVSHSTAKVTRSTAIGSGLIFASVSAKSDSNLLTLSESSDPLWSAIMIGQKFDLLPHQLFNNWANAWLVPPGEHTIIIFYWPQLLSWLGYVLLAGAGVGLAIAARRRKKVPSLHQKIRRHFSP